MEAATGSLELDLEPHHGVERLAPGAYVLRGFDLPCSSESRMTRDRVTEAAPFRHMTTTGRHRMSVAMTSCGAFCWVSDQRGYRYEPVDPETGRPWPAMPETILRLGREAAASAGFPGFEPDACLVNRYAPGTKLSLHQDKDELDCSWPIVSVSLGVSAIFLFGGERRQDPVARVRLAHGDVVVWGGRSRLRYHGVAPLGDAWHPFAGPCRINLTLRRAR